MFFRFKNFFLITLFFGISFFLLFFVVGISTPSSSLAREGSSNSESKSLVSEQKIGKRTKEDFKNKFKSYLKKFAEYGIDEFTVLNDGLNKVYQIGHLTSLELEKDYINFSPDAKSQLGALYDEFIEDDHNNGGLLETQLQTDFNFFINTYRDTLEKGLNLFKQYGVSNPRLNGKEYQLASLQGANLTLDQNAWDYTLQIHIELSALYKADPQITFQHFTAALNRLMDPYKQSIQDGLNLFAKYNINIVVLDNKEYQLDQLLNTDNLYRSAAGLSPVAAKQLKTIHDDNITLQHFEDAFNLLINKYRNTLKPGLELFKQYGLSRVELNNIWYSLAELQEENLVSNAWDYSSDAYAELSALYKGKENSGQVGIADFKTAFNTLINAYRTQLKPGLDLFAKYGLSSATMDYELFQFVELHKANLVSNDAWGYASEVHTELSVLYKGKGSGPVYIADFEVVFNLLINSYRDQLKSDLDKFEQYGLSSVTLDSREYQLADLQKADLTSDQNTWGYTEETHDELSALYKADIKHQQFKTALNQILTTRKTQVQKEKEEKAPKQKAKDKKTALTIGLATGGGALLLAGGAGGFLYWFYKIKK